MRHFLAIHVLLIPFCFAQAAYGQTTTNVSTTTSGDWTTTANLWGFGGYPDNDPGTVRYTASIGSGHTVSLNSNITIDDFILTGELDLASNVLLDIVGPESPQTSASVINNGGTISGGTVTYGAGTNLTIQAAATFTGGTVNLQGDTTWADDGGTLTVDGVLNLEGTMTVNGYLSNDPQFSGSGTVSVKSGATLNDGYSNPITIDSGLTFNIESGGKLELLGDFGGLTINTSAFTNKGVIAGADADGAPTITITSLNNDGTLSPGDTSTGTMTIMGDVTQSYSAHLAIDLAAPSTKDLLAVSGDFTAGGQLDLTLADATAFSTSDSPYTIVTAGGDLFGTFWNAPATYHIFDPVNVWDVTFAVNYNYVADTISLTVIQSVPEPSSLVLLAVAVALGGGVVVRRRRRNAVDPQMTRVI